MAHNTDSVSHPHSLDGHGDCRYCGDHEPAEGSECPALNADYERVITFAEVSAVNRARCLRWHPGFPDDEDWSLADWCLAMVGEAGEAANVVKKIHRQKYGLRGRLDPPIAELAEALAEELADVYLYLDLLAAKAGIDLPAAIVAKFNKVSERQGFPDRLPSDSLRADNQESTF